MNPYTSMWTGTTRRATGPRTFHLVLLDNGRTDTLADEVGRQALRCIRCSACLNVCPVYERAGRPRLRLGLPRARSAPSSAPTARHRERDRRLAAVRLLAVRRLLRGVPGRDRHPRGAGAPARAGRRGRPGDPAGHQGHPEAGQGPRRRTRGDARGALGVRATRARCGPGSAWRPGPAGCIPRHAARPGRRVERDPRSARGAARAVPRLVAAYRGGNGRTNPVRPARSRDRRRAAGSVILARVRRALADVPAEDGPRTSGRRPRYDRGARRAHSGARRSDLLAENLADYRARRAPLHRRRAAAAIAGLLADRGSRSGASCRPGCPPQWLRGRRASTVVQDRAERAPPTTGRVDSVVTGCAVAIAETGTLVLDGGPDQGRRRITLVPDHHICVVRVPGRSSPRSRRRCNGSIRGAR